MGTKQNLVDRLEASALSWSAYGEDLPASNPCNGSNLYPSFSTVRHFPFFYFTDITGNSTRCSHTHHASSVGSGCTSNCDPELISELNGPSPADYVWLTPNDCDNMHSCSVTIGDNYLKALVPNILNSNLFKTKNAVLFIVFDEGSATYSSDYVYAVWAGAAAKLAFKSTTNYTHYSYLKTLETAWGLASLQTTDGGASAMTEFFGATAPPIITTSFTTNIAGTAANFTGTALGGTAPYTFRWNFGDGQTGTGSPVNHVYASPGSYSVTLNATDSLGRTGSSSQIVTVGTSGGSNPPVIVNRQYWGTFYYPWYGASPWRHWNDMGHTPPATWASNYLPDDGSGVYNPSAELYGSTSTITMNRHLNWMNGAGFNFALVSWWGQGGYEDLALSSMLNQVSRNSSLNVKLAAYYEAEGTSDPTVSQIVSDLTYIHDNRANSTGYFTVSNGTRTFPVVFVYAGPTDAATYVSRWSQARSQMYALGKPMYIVLKVYTGFATSAAMVDNWYQYSPSTRYEVQTGYSAFASPGYWEYPELAISRGHCTSPCTGGYVGLPRNATAFAQSVVTMNNLNLAQAQFLLVETFNEFHEGSQIEPAFQISHIETGFTQASPSFSLTYLNIVGGRGGNTPPVLTVPGPQTSNVGARISFTVSASDSPMETVSLSASSLPANATFLIASGVGFVSNNFVWTPSSSQIGVFLVIFTATDNGSPSLATTRSVSITVLPPGSSPPILNLIGNKTINELTLLTFAATATDADGDALAFTLGFGGPIGATITSNGIFTWTPSEAQGPGTYKVTIVVTDNGSPPSSASSTITITVNEVNLPPILVVLGSQTVNEGANISFTVSATDPDIPAETITYFATGLPAGSSFSSFSRTFSWTPSEAQGPGDYSISFIATDSGSPPLSTSMIVAIHVNEVNSPPILSVPGSLTSNAGSSISFTVTATDSDLPAEVITLSASGLPSGASFSPSSHVFSWTPSGNQAGSYIVTFTARDNGTPSLSDSKAVTIIVQSASSSGGACAFCWVPLRVSTALLLVVGAAFGVMLSVVGLTLKERARLQRARRRFAYA